MKISIDETVCKNLGLDLSSVFIMLLIKLDTNISKIIDNLLDKEVLIKETDLFNNFKYSITQRWDDVLSNILLDSEQPNLEKNEERLTNLAKSLMQIFPQGKKEGTNTYWRGNIKDTKLKLKKFFKLYGSKYTDEQILEATKNYVESFNGNYSFMRVLRYFIWKDVRKIDSEGNGYIEEVSDLASYIENKNQNNIDKDWTTNIV